MMIHRTRVNNITPASVTLRTIQTNHSIIANVISNYTDLPPPPGDCVVSERMVFLRRRRASAGRHGDREAARARESHRLRDPMHDRRPRHRRRSQLSRHQHQIPQTQVGLRFSFKQIQIH